MKGKIGKQLIDLTGKKFGLLTVLSRAENYTIPTGTYPMWNVVCECGTHKIVRGQFLRGGTTRSCGCRSGRHGLHKKDDLTGKRFGTFTVQEYICTNNGNRLYLCICDCKTARVVNQHELETGRRKGCCFSERLTDGQIASYLKGSRRKNVAVQQELKKDKKLIEAKRNQLRLQRIIKKQENETRNN